MACIWLYTLKRHPGSHPQLCQVQRTLHWSTSSRGTERQAWSVCKAHTTWLTQLLWVYPLHVAYFLKIILSLHLLHHFDCGVWQATIRNNGDGSKTLDQASQSFLYAYFSVKTSLKSTVQKLPGSPVVVILCCDCWGLEFNRWLGNQDHTRSSATKTYTYIVYMVVYSLLCSIFLCY